MFLIQDGQQVDNVPKCVANGDCSKIIFLFSGSELSSRHNMVSSLRYSVFSLVLLPFGIKSATMFHPMRNFNAPHRTGLVDFPHPALRFNSPYR